MEIGPISVSRLKIPVESDIDLLLADFASPWVGKNHVETGEHLCEHK